MGRRVARAIVADSDHQDLGAQGPETVPLLQVVLELLDQLLLDVHHAPTHLADRVVVIAARELVVSRPIAEVRRVNAA
jgi:hypothetical protein